MSILTEVEMELPEGDTLAHEHAEGWVAVRSYARALEVKLLEKLAGMELPEPAMQERGPLPCEWMHYYTATQLHQAYAQGAASQLARTPSGWICQSKKLPMQCCIAMNLQVSDDYTEVTPLYKLKEAK